MFLHLIVELKDACQDDSLENAWDKSLGAYRLSMEGFAEGICWSRGYRGKECWTYYIDPIDLI